jgi:hypothetical protein
MGAPSPGQPISFGGGMRPGQPHIGQVRSFSVPGMGGPPGSKGTGAVPPQPGQMQAQVDPRGRPNPGQANRMEDFRNRERPQQPNQPHGGNNQQQGNQSVMSVADVLRRQQAYFGR